MSNIEYEIDVVEPIVHDSRGLIKNDVAHLKSIFKQKRYNSSNTKEEIMYLEGQLSVIDYIENRMVSKGGL